MDLNSYQIKVLEAKVCPYCKSDTKLVSETDVYGREYSGKGVFVCNNYPSCDSYVGTHKDGRALGRLANKELREMKMEAHLHFDELWKSKKMTRKDAYALLSEYLKLPIEYTHIGMFSIATCRKVVAWSKNYKH